MAELVSRGINSFKFFMAYKGALMVTDEELLQGFKACRRLGALAQASRTCSPVFSLLRPFAGT